MWFNEDSSNGWRKVMIFIRWIRSWHLLARFALWGVERKILWLRGNCSLLDYDIGRSLNAGRRHRLIGKRNAMGLELQRLEGVGEGLREQIAGKHDRPRLSRVA